MKFRSRAISRILFLGGALLLLEGSFSVYPFLFPSGNEVQADVYPRTPSAGHFDEGAYLFRLSLPRQHADFNVVEGTTNKALRKGPGHLVGSAMPNVIGNVVVAGHRDTHFRVLKDVGVGDEIRISSGNEQYVY